MKEEAGISYHFNVRSARQELGFCRDKHASRNPAFQSLEFRGFEVMFCMERKDCWVAWNPLIPRKLEVQPYLFIDLRSPPCETVHPTGIDDHEKDHQNSKGNTRIQSGRKNHGIFTPPCRSATTHEIVEGKTDESPDGEIQAGLTDGKLLVFFNMTKGVHAARRQV